MIMIRMVIKHGIGIKRIRILRQNMEEIEKDGI